MSESNLPNSFNEADADLILESLQSGGSWNVACQTAGVSVQNVRAWLELGRAPGAPIGLAKFAHLADALRPGGLRESYPIASKECLDTVLDGLRNDESWQNAAAAAGVDMNAVNSWRRRGRKPGAPEHLRAFVEEADKVRSVAESRRRPKRSQFTPEVREIILEGLRSGLSTRKSVANTDVAPRTVSYWLAQGRKQDAPPEVRQFVLDVAQARAEAIVKASTAVDDA